MDAVSWTGQTLKGRYQIQELLGRGGMSSVYKAWDPNLRRTVAIKLIHPHLSDSEEFLRRFEEEAAAVAQLRHSNIIQVYDFDHEQGTYYMVLEFLSGEPLQNRLKRLSTDRLGMSVPEAIRYTIQICEAVDYAHKRGMIHRDIKPANIMLSDNDQAILMDFGIAKIVSGPQHTATGAVIGTVMYMSPEQIRGEHIDQRSDVYSIGVTLFEMVSGHPPFEGDSTMSLMLKHLNDPVPDLRSLNPQLPEELVQVIEKSLAKDANERYQSAQEMAAALRRVQSAMQARAASGLSGVVHRVSSTATQVAARQTAANAAVGIPLSQFPSSTQVLEEEQPAVNPLRGNRTLFAAVGCAVLLVVLACASAGAYFITRNGSIVTSATAQARVYTQTAVDSTLTAISAIAFTPTLTFTATNEPKITPLPSTATSTEVQALVEQQNQAATLPANAPKVMIIRVTLEGETYVVDYETVGFIEKMTGKHIHFFFNNIRPEDAGMSGQGPWYMYGGPRPFAEATINDQPPGTTQICAIVANPDHTVIPDSGSCFDLPQTSTPYPPVANPTPQPTRKPTKDRSY